MKKILKLTTILLFISATKIWAQPKIGELLEKYSTPYQDSPSYILTSPGQIDKGYLIQVDSILYTVVPNNEPNKKIKFIMTSDKKFKTVEGFSMATTYSDLNASGLKTVNEHGWAKFIKLKSGWCIAFDYKNQLTDSSTVQFFFKK